jgi:TetR/AcrR family transcriptional regulator, transcriptional repressor for nem operon
MFWSDLSTLTGPLWSVKSKTKLSPVSNQPTSAPGGFTRKGQATRQRIVEVAAALMSEHGVAETSTLDVQNAAGISASQLYHYFSDKKALIHAVVVHQTEAVLAAQSSMLAQLDSIEGLEAWRDAMVELQQRLQCQGGCPMGSLSSMLADIDPDARATLAAGFARWEDAIRQGLRSMQERGELSPDADVDSLALATLAAVQGGLLLTQARRDTLALSTVLTVVIDRICSETIRRR